MIKHVQTTFNFSINFQYVAVCLLIQNCLFSNEGICFAHVRAVCLNFEIAIYNDCNNFYNKHFKGSDYPKIFRGTEKTLNVILK